MATDSQSAVRELEAGSERQTGKVEQDIWRLTREMFHEASEGALCNQWVLSHCSLPYNDEADRFAKEAAGLPQEDVAIGIKTAEEGRNGGVGCGEEEGAGGAPSG